MASLPPNLSTDSVPVRERAPYWQDWLNRLFRGLDTHFYGDLDFEGQLRSARAGDVVLTRLEAQRHHVARSPQQARASLGDSESGHLKIVAPLLGSASVHQEGRSANVKPGEWSIYDTSQPYAVDNPRRVEHLIVVLPKAPFVQRGLALDTLMARTLGGSNEGAVARLALHTMRSAFHELSDMSDGSARGVGDAIIQLVSLSLLDLAGTPTAVSQKAQQRERIKRHVATRLSDPTLSVDSVATALGCSRRQLYNAFADEPDGVAGYILRQRLLAAQRLFGAPALQQASITDVALRCGFSNLSHFSRVFRLHVGTAPSEYRRRVSVEPALP